MWVKRRHRVVFWLLRFPFRVFFKLKYHFFSVKYKLEKKPYLILSNHLTTLDPFMLALSFKRPIYYMTSADLFSSKYKGIIEWLVAPIPKNKSVKDIGAIKGCLRVLKEQGTICVFPEGNRSYTGNLCYIDESIAKFVKMMKVDLVLYNICGGYGIDPRWCKKGRKGYSYGKVKRVVPYSEIEKMSIDDLYKMIIDELTVRQIPTPYEYKSSKKAMGLERILYLCPVCGKIETIETKGNFVYCNYCGLKVKYNNNLTFTSDNEKFKFNTVSDWYNYQLEYIKNYDFNHNNIIFNDQEVKLLKMRLRKRGELLEEGHLKMYSSKIVINDQEFNLSDIYSMTVLGKHKLNFYIDDKTYQLKGNDNFNALKYVQMYYHINNVNNGQSDDFFGL